MHNPSDAPRAMFALVYTDAQGYSAHVEQFGHELAFSPTCSEAFASSQLAPLDHIRFTDDHTPAPPQLLLGYSTSIPLSLTQTCFPSICK
jgi:hypothetical protein